LPYQIDLTPRAQRELDELPAKEAVRVARALFALAEEPRPRGVRKLTGTAAPMWRIRIGDHRVIYSVSDAARRVIVLRIARRGGGTYEGL
jgi:mRNA interferase RelE/StbE